MPKLPGAVTLLSDRNKRFEVLGDDLSSVAMQCVNERGVFHLALSGGSTPQPFYKQLATSPRYESCPWGQTHIWQVDERRVPENHFDSNIRMIRESLIDLLHCEAPQVHAIPAMQQNPAALYEATLLESFAEIGADPPQLDFVLLGMGDDGHTASLFPNSTALGVPDRWIVENDGPFVVPPARITMTFPLLNAARSLAVLCIGPVKQMALRHVSALDKPDIRDFPISGIRSTNLTWYLDKSAAGVTS